MAANVEDWISRDYTEFHKQVNMANDYLNDPSTNRMKKFGIEEDTPPYWSITSYFPHSLANFNMKYDTWLKEGTYHAEFYLKDSMRSFRSSYRNLFVMFKSNPKVTDSHLVKMGMPKCLSGDNTVSSNPTTIRDVEFDLNSPASVRSHYRYSNWDRKGKPPGIFGVEAVYLVSDTPVTDPGELTQSFFGKRVPLILKFPAKARGRRVYVAFRCEDLMGRKGKLSEIYSAIVPEVIKGQRPFRRRKRRRRR
jgi:hypothetical protein